MMILIAFTIVHVAISLVAILAGLVATYGMITAQRFDGWTKLFLWMTALTTVSGFFFPFRGFTPAIGLGLLSLPVLAVALFAWYARQLAGGWRKAYVISAVLALYFNVFVLVVQSFQKIPALNAIAPTQNDPPFKLAQLVVLVMFVTLGVLAVVKFREVPIRAA